MIVGTRKLTLELHLEAPSLKAYDAAITEISRALEAVRPGESCACRYHKLAGGAKLRRLYVVRVERKGGEE